MIKHLEVKTYEYCGINVTVSIDYDRSFISLLEKKDNGEELKHYQVAKQKEKDDDVCKALDMATDMIKFDMTRDAKKFIDKKINAKGNRNRKS